MNKTVQRAQELKAEGKIYMASVVKSVYYTTYYHVVPIEKVIKAGKWIPANTVTFESGAVGRAGISGKQIDWTITGRK
jgi:hypothetical protein